MTPGPTTNGFPAAALLRQAVLDFAAGRAAQARSACREILRAAPDHAATLHLSGLVEHREGNQADAMRLLRRAVESPDATALFWLSYAEFGCKPVDYAAAIEAARHAVRIDERGPLGWYCLGNLLMETGGFDEAHACFARALALEPHFCEARAQLAMATFRLGDAHAAVALFEALRAELPSDVRVALRFAALLEDLGRHEDALREALRGIALDPQALDLHLQAAGSESARGRHAAALARLETLETPLETTTGPAIGPTLGTRKPADTRLITMKMHLLRLLDRNDEAVALGRAGVAKGVEAAAFLRAFALALQLLGGEDEALGLFDRAAAADRASAAACLTDRGVLLTDMGRATEAVECFDSALVLDPRLADAWYNKSNAKTHRRDDPDIGAMERLLTAGIAYRDRLLLHFALGKAHMEAGDEDAALAHWHEGNRMKRAIIDYDSEAALAAMRGAMTATAGAASRTASRSQCPVFIVGMPRSGSSLIEQILAAHPEVHGGGELLQLRALFEEGLPPPGGAGAAGAARRLAQAALGRLRRRAGTARRVIDKDLANFLHVGTIHRLFPRARIIHCRRDPLDTCFSIYTKLFSGNLGFAYELGELGRYYCGYRDLMAHWRSVLPATVLLEVDYELLVAAPERETRRLLAFLGLPWDPACAASHESARTVRTSSSLQVRQPVYRSSVGRAAALRRHLEPLVAALAGNS
jgi:tetratricopeptide (TPR) repeat protein